MAGYDLENKITIAILVALTVVYLYLLLSPTQPHVSNKASLSVVIRRDSRQRFEEFIKNDVSSGYDDQYRGKSFNYSEYNAADWQRDGWGAEGQRDDFFLDAYEASSGKRERESEFDDDKPVEQITPSQNFHCLSGWLTVRSQVNYKYLWMHGDERQWMGASATMDTPMHRKTFYSTPLSEDCKDGQGWVLLREGDSQSFIQMISPNHTTADNVTRSAYADDLWAITLGTEDAALARNDLSYHFLLETEGFMLNREAMAFVNILAESDYPARGHSGGWNRKRPATREFGATMHFDRVEESAVLDAIAREEKEEQEAREQDKKYIESIKGFTNPKNEKRVISFGLYGAKPKYTTGAIRNVELQKIYFPEWTCRFYVTSDVPKDVLDKLVSLGAEIEEIPSGMGYTSGMFWRFLVASDPSVDRYIIRDSDSRLNARDRMAVEEWIESKQPIHILRDHVNHCIVMNGGMWGGVKGAIDDMATRVKAWDNRNEYMADLHFLDQYVWPDIKNHHIAHDSYCCDRYPNTRPFPTQRYMNYQHVGQVFDEQDRARLTDIDGFIRGVPIPSSCRKQPEWIYG